MPCFKLPSQSQVVLPGAAETVVLIQEPERAQPEAVETHDGIGIFRVGPSQRLDQAVASVSEALVQARAAGLDRLMVVIPELDLAPPSVAERVNMVRQWADRAGGRIRVAMVAPASLMDPERLGVVAARGFGLDGNSFLHEQDALDWLQEDA